MKRDGTNRLHYLLPVPRVGVILFFIATTVLVTVARSFGMFSITGTSAFTLKHWAVVATREARDSVLFSLKMGVLASVGTVLVAFPVALFFLVLPFSKAVHARRQVRDNDLAELPGDDVGAMA